MKICYYHVNSIHTSIEMSPDQDQHRVAQLAAEQQTPVQYGHRKLIRFATNLAMSTSVAVTGIILSHEPEPIDIDIIALASNEVTNSAVTNPAPEDTYIVSTYNVMGSQFPSAWSLDTRMSGVATIVNGQDIAPRSDVVVLQEVMTGKNQYGMLDNKLDKKGYALFPSANKMRTNVIGYDKDRFRLLSAGLVPYPFYEDSRAKNGKWEMSGRAPWVYLEDKKTDQKIATIGARFVAWNTDRGSDPGGAQKRKASAEIMQKWAVKFQQKHPNSIVTVANDDNAGNYLRDKFGKNWTTDNPNVRHKDDALSSRNGLPYCIQTSKPEFLQNARDSVYGMYGRCSYTKHSGNLRVDMKDQRLDWTLAEDAQVTIDAVYISPQTAAVADYDQNISILGRKASDHHLMWSKLVARVIKDGESVKSVVLSERTRIPD